MDARDGLFVVFESGKRFFGDTGLAKRGTQAAAQRLHVMKIFAEGSTAASHVQRVADAIGLHQRIAVAISADPGTEVDHVGDGEFVEFDAIDVAKGIHDLA